MDDPRWSWQSCGAQGKHWIRLEIHSGIVIKQLKMVVDPADSSYMPSLIAVNAGTTFTSLTEKLNIINVKSNDTIINLLTDMEQVCVCSIILLLQMLRMCVLL